MIMEGNAPMRRRFKVMRWENPAMDKPTARSQLRAHKTRRFSGVNGLQHHSDYIPSIHVPQHKWFYAHAGW